MEHLTDLNAELRVEKTDARIVFRGKVDTLESEILLALCDSPTEYQGLLLDAVNLLRQVMSSGVTGKPLTAWTLGGMNAENVQKLSHNPEKMGFAGHIQPSVSNGRLSLQMNRLRALTREAELAAIHAYPEEREDLLLAMNRLSSYFYVLQLRFAQ